jgi:predicted transcriptional regulator
MALQAVTSSSGSSKQIAVSLNSTAGTVVYTVATGKTFTGVAVGYPGTNGGYIGINGVTVGLVNGANPTSAVVPLTLVSGTVVTSSATSCALIGVEQ